MRLNHQPLLTARSEHSLSLFLKCQQAKASHHGLRGHKVPQCNGLPYCPEEAQVWGKCIKGVISCRPPGLEVAGRSSAWVSRIPKEHKLVLARKGQVLTHIIRGPDTLLSQAHLDPGDLTIPLIRGSKRLGFSPKGHNFQKTSLYDGPASSTWQP